MVSEHSEGTMSDLGAHVKIFNTKLVSIHSKKYMFEMDF